MSTNRQSKTRRSFLPMAATYCLGVFNDNYFKQAAMLLAVAAGLSHLQGWAAVLFSLPFILFAAQGGWCADRFPKKRMIVFSKGLEIGAMLIGGAGLIFSNWPCILAMVFLMGLQSTFFGPALNGSIPEIYPAESVPKTNALLKLLTTLAILAGIATAGFSLDQQWFRPEAVNSGPAAVAVVAILASVLGFTASFGIRKTGTRGAHKPFPWFGPLNSLKDLREISKDKQLLLAIVADTWFYFIASMTILVINSLGILQLGFSQSLTSLLPASLMVGVCAGSLLAARTVDIENWSDRLVSSNVLMALSMIAAGTVTLLPESCRFAWVCLTLFAAGTGGGLFLIPVTSTLQIRPSRQEKGKVIAAAGFTSFCAILLSGLLFNLMQTQFTPSSLMLLLGATGLVFSIILGLLQKSANTSHKLISIFLKLILSLRYKVDVKGLEKIAANGNEKILFLPNHPALIDPVIVMSRLLGQFSPRPFSNVDQISHPVIRRMVAPIRPITIPDVQKGDNTVKHKIRAALDEVVQCLERDENILFYPAGRLYREQYESLGSNSGVEQILNRVPGARVVLVRTTGLWGSSFSRASGSSPSLFKRVGHYLKCIIANGLFFIPKRTLTLEFVEDPAIVSLKTRERINSHLESWYNKTAQPNTHVPYFRWQGNTPQTLPEPETRSTEIRRTDVPDFIRLDVIRKIEEIAGTQVKGHQSLSKDLGLDSLTVMEIGSWIEQEYNVSLTDMESLETVNDCLHAASGSVCSKTPEIPAPAAGWFANGSMPLNMGNGDNIARLFLEQAKKTPGKTIIADTLTGSKTYRQIMTAIFALQPHIRAIQGDRVGIMLPASMTAAIVYMATLFSGKTPVLFNWTAGPANILHGIEDTGVTAILSATQLCRRVEQQQDTDLSALPVQWIHLDTLGAKLTRTDKLIALAKSWFGVSLLTRQEISETAAILFTSGSESKPKPVPLSHKNILANLRDFSALLEFDESQRLLGILPPFHSLGLAGTIIMPLCLGLPTVYSPNPTEGSLLAGIIEKYKATMLVSTPTFLNTILQAGSVEQIHSLQTVFTGAEKCPDQVRTKLRDMNPNTELCEGYGITECSPLVSINLPGRTRPGTIGKVLPSMEYAIVTEDLSRSVPSGKQGLLLVRGPNIFSGYLNSAPEKGFVNFENTSWYATGDFVREDGAGYLVFCGRKKRFIKIGGEMISLPAIENVLLNALDLRGSDSIPIAVEATADESHPEIVLFSTKPLDRAVVNEKLREAGLSGLHNIRRLVQVEDIPLLGSGKTDYRQLKQQLAA